MASIETYIADIADPNLRAKIEAEVAELKKRLEWGLVFEKHLPETTRLLSAPIKVGTAVWERRSAKPRRFRVRAIEPGELVVVAEPEKTTAPADAPIERIARDNVLVEHEFTKPIFPAPASLGAIRNGPPDRPSHAVIQGENYHALQMLLAAYKGKVDVLYLDPPYNTGERDWSYNNDYVDPDDTYRPSKWLAFMERRLRMAQKLLKADGIVVVAIDENEHAPLVMLLQQIFPGYDIASISIVHNPRGIQGDNFSFTNEFAVFVVPGKGLIAPRAIPIEERDTRDLRDNGGESLRIDARNCFYPIYVREGVIIGFGDVLPDDEHPVAVNEPQPDGSIAVWPIDVRGIERKWRYARHSVDGILDWLAARQVGRARPKRWDIAITKPTGIHRTVWIDPRYDANAFGTKVIRGFAASDFSFPKSLYNLYDILYTTTIGRPEALIVDYFAGSGTTLHATMLINALEGGQRRCVLITNNDLNHADAARLNKEGHFRGDAEFESEGVFEASCRPRVKAALTGLRPDDTPVPGEYLGGRPHAAGFEENVEFFELTYLDEAEVNFGLRYRELEPLIWLRAGGIGEREELDPERPLGIPANSPYAVLFDPSGVPELLKALPSRPDIKLVFVVAPSAESFAQMAADLPAGVEPVRLYRDYTETLRRAMR